MFLGRELSEAARSPDFVSAEELDLEVRRIWLEEALSAVRSGRVGNFIAVAGILGR